MSIALLTGHAGVGRAAAIRSDGSLERTVNGGFTHIASAAATVQSVVELAQWAIAPTSPHRNAFSWLNEFGDLELSDGRAVGFGGRAPQTYDTCDHSGSVYETKNVRYSVKLTGRRATDGDDAAREDILEIERELGRTYYAHHERRCRPSGATAKFEGDYSLKSLGQEREVLFSRVTSVIPHFFSLRINGRRVYCEPRRSSGCW